MRKHQLADIVWRDVKWTRPYKLENVWAVLTHLSAATPRGAVIWEARGKNGQVTYLLGADRMYMGKVEKIFHAHGTMQCREVSGENRQPVAIAEILKISHPSLSLNTDIAESVTPSGPPPLAGGKSAQELVLQVVLGRGFAPSPVPAELPDPNATWIDILCGNVSKATAETRKSVKSKAEQHGFQAAVRIGVSGKEGLSRLYSLVNAFRVLESAGVHIRNNHENPDRINSVHVPWSFPLRLSVQELTNFLLLPAGEEDLPGSPGLHPKPALPPAWYHSPTSSKTDRTFAVSMDITPKKLSISPSDSLTHSHVLGPTGSGKSTLLQHLILSDIRAGRSVLVCDPKAELVNDILARVPEERTGDVVVIDPSDCIPVGFNPLAFKNYQNKALIADAILSVLQELWSDSWGIRIQDILSAALLTLAEIDGATLLWLQPLLTDNNFRKKIIVQVKDKVGLMPFWNEFETLSDLQRQQWVAPVSNKLRQFTMRPGLRNVLGQSHPKFDLTELFTKRKIVLVPLNKALLGESARLLGGFIIGMTWTLALSRASIPPERRHIVSVYIDEVQDYLNLPGDISDALAQARGLGVGMTLAHQYRDQLSPEIRAGVDANCLNKIIFGLNSKDAKDIAAMAPELTAEDFMMLPRYQIYTSFQSSGRSTSWVMGRALPPTPALRDPVELRAQSMENYGVPAKEVGDEYLKMFRNGSFSGTDPDTPIGRRRKS